MKPVGELVDLARAHGFELYAVQKNHEPQLQLKILNDVTVAWVWDCEEGRAKIEGFISGVVWCRGLMSNWHTSHKGNSL